MKTILFLVTEDYYFYTHRLSLAMALLRQGYRIVVVTRCKEYKQIIESKGIEVIYFNFYRRGVNPIRELRIICGLIRLYRRVRPDIVHHVALKPVVYGSIAARFAKVPLIINAITGLGSVFTHSSYTVKFLKHLLTQSFRFVLNASNSHVIAQNFDDKSYFVQHGVNPCLISVVNGAGVDLDLFQYSPWRQSSTLKITFVSRMLWSKGIAELIDAVRLLKKESFKFEVCLVGSPDPGNFTTISEESLIGWEKEGLISWLGQRDDINEIWQNSHIAVLPSYREGLPKSLLEAAACGKPIVTTDVPGCRDVVQDGYNGFLVPVKDSNALAEALKKLLLDDDLCKLMGERNRQLAERKFSLTKIINETFFVYQSLDVKLNAEYFQKLQLLSHV